MSWQEKVRNRLPNLVVNEFRWVRGNIFIDDIGLDQLGFNNNDIPELKAPSQLLTPGMLNNLLLKIWQPELFQTIIWPGKGAKFMQCTLGIAKGINIAAERLGYKNPEAWIAEFHVPKDSNIAVADDVVSSGVTARRVHEKGKLIKASLAAWIMQNPSDILLRCYEKIFIACLVRGDNGKVPINSLSTFLEKSEVLEDYAKRYARNAQEFIEFFAWLKKEGLGREV